MIGLSPAAKQDLIDHYVYFGEEDADLADRFLDAVDATLDRLEAMPRMGRVFPTANPRIAGLRMFAVPGFPKHLVFYRVVDEGIEVMRVLHGARDLAELLADD